MATESPTSDSTLGMIAYAFNTTRDMVLGKSRAYGDQYENVLVPSMKEQDMIIVRISDKIRRLRNLIRYPSTETGDEPMKDTIRDIMGYCALWMVYLERTKQNGNKT